MKFATLTRATPISVPARNVTVGAIALIHDSWLTVDSVTVGHGMAIIESGNVAFFATPDTSVFIR